MIPVSWADPIFMIRLTDRSLFSMFKLAILNLFNA